MRPRLAWGMNRWLTQLRTVPELTERYEATSLTVIHGVSGDGSALGSFACIGIIQIRLLQPHNSPSVSLQALGALREEGLSIEQDVKSIDNAVPLGDALSVSHKSEDILAPMRP